MQVLVVCSGTTLVRIISLASCHHQRRSFQILSLVWVLVIYSAFWMPWLLFFCCLHRSDRKVSVWLISFIFLSVNIIVVKAQSIFFRIRLAFVHVVVVWLFITALVMLGRLVVFAWIVFSGTVGILVVLRCTQTLLLIILWSLVVIISAVFFFVVVIGTVLAIRIDLRKVSTLPAIIAPTCSTLAATKYIFLPNRAIWRKIVFILRLLDQFIVR